MFSALLATTINVPGDYSTIQYGIDAASDGDIVLVQSGTIANPITYTENLIIEAGIILMSSGGHQSTIIDGSNPADNMGSTITIRPVSGSAIIPQNIEIDGFEITGGIGNSMNRDTPNGTVTRRIGGGIMVYNTAPKINNNNIKGNGSALTANGGGIIALDSAEDWSFNDRDWELNPELPPATSDLDFSNNIFYENDASYGHSVFIEGFENRSTNLSNGEFDCYSSDYQTVSEYWVKGELTDFIYEGSQGTEPIYTEVWVNPVDGVDGGNTTGDIEHPFRTINFALGMVYGTEENPVIIHLQNGTYSPDSGESFPIIMLDYISFQGENEELTVLDGLDMRRIMNIFSTVENSFSNLTIHRGNGNDGNDPDDDGSPGYIGIEAGGIFIDSSSPTFLNVTFSNHIADHGGAILIVQSDAIFSDVLFINNIANGAGGSLFITVYSNPIFTNAIFTNNQGEQPTPWGGGIMIEFGSDPTFNNIIINSLNAYQGGAVYCHNNASGTFNDAEIVNNWSEVGGVIYLSECDMEFNNVIINKNYSVGGASALTLEASNLNLYHGTLSNNYHNSIDPVTAPSAISLWQNSNLDIINSIIWGNELAGSITCMNDEGCQYLNVNYSNIDGGFEGEGNINIDPLFSDSENGDYTLQEGSPCIDAGTIIEGLEYYGMAPDMGAFEYIPNQQNGDLNGDGSINIIDIVVLVNIILNDLDAEGADFNDDGSVNVIDVVILVQFILYN